MIEITIGIVFALALESLLQRFSKRSKPVSRQEDIVWVISVLVISFVAAYFSWPRIVYLLAVIAISLITNAIIRKVMAKRESTNVYIHE